MTTFLEFLCFVVCILLIVGLFKPSLVLRWTKKPTRLKVFGYWILSFALLAIFLALIDFQPENKKSLQEEKQLVSKPDINVERFYFNKIKVERVKYSMKDLENTKDTFHYEIIEKDNRFRGTIAYYDAETYNVENIDKILLLIRNQANSKKGITLYSSKRIANIDLGNQWIAYLTDSENENEVNIKYKDKKIEFLNNPVNGEEHLFFINFLKERNTDIYEINEKMDSIYSYLSETQGDLSTYDDEVAKLLHQYNIPKSFEYTLRDYLIYCR